MISSLIAFALKRVGAQRGAAQREAHAEMRGVSPRRGLRLEYLGHRVGHHPVGDPGGDQRHRHGAEQRMEARRNGLRPASHGFEAAPRSTRAEQRSGHMHRPGQRDGAAVGMAQHHRPLGAECRRRRESRRPVPRARRPRSVQARGVAEAGTVEARSPGSAGQPPGEVEGDSRAGSRRRRGSARHPAPRPRACTDMAVHRHDPARGGKVASVRASCGRLHEGTCRRRGRARGRPGRWRAQPRSRRRSVTLCPISERSKGVVW